MFLSQVARDPKTKRKKNMKDDIAHSPGGQTHETPNERQCCFVTATFVFHINLKDVVN